MSCTSDLGSQKKKDRKVNAFKKNGNAKLPKQVRMFFES